MPGVTCPACGREGTGRFCGRCGARLPITCPGCGTANDSADSFCTECGGRLGGVSPVPEPETPGHLTERILDARRHLEGERKQVTVLFADVSGSMDLAAQLDAEEWAEIMDRFFALLSEGVHRFEGTVDKFTGDGIMALFGAPIAHEDHARRACFAALHLAETISTYAGELRRTKGLGFHVRLGLNSGEVVVGRIGDDARMEYTALGHTVGLAQRMEALAEPGKAFLTEHTAALVSGWFRLRDLGRFEVKGSPEPLTVHVLEGVAGRRQTAGTTTRVALTGRTEEMAGLEAALARAGEGDSQIISVVGEAGVGKSRLCEEFATRCAAAGIIVRRAAGLSHARAVPLLPILDLLRDYFGVTEADSPTQARGKVGARLLALDSGLEATLPLLFDFLEVSDLERPPPQLGPEVRMRRIFEVLRRVSQLRSDRQLLVLVLEDLHWFDPQSAAFLEELVPLYPGTRTLVVANFRPGFHAAWMDGPSYRQIDLQPLPPEAVREVMAAMLGQDPSLTPLPDHVIDRTGGNPFFVEEVVRALIEDGTLQGQPGAYRLTRPLDQVKVPSTVQATLAARIDRLPRFEKQVLQNAAVIGRTFPEPVLRLVTGRPDDTDDVPSALLRLSANQFLQEEGASPVHTFRFWHPLTQEVAYGSLLTERRARLHAAVARAIIELEPERLDERAALIATHFERSGEAFEAARWNARAAARAVRSDVTEAVRRWRKALTLLAGLPENDEVLRLGVDARTRLLQFGSRMGLSPSEAEALFEEGRNLAERLHDVGPLAGITQFRGTVILADGQISKAVECYLEAARLAERSDDVARRAAGWMSPPVFMAYTGPTHEGLHLTDRVIALCAGDPELGVRYAGYSPLASAIRTRAELLSLLGRLPEASQDAAQAVVMARGRQESEMLAWSLATCVRLAQLSGDERGSLAYAKEAVRLTEDSENLMFRVVALGALGVAELLRGGWKAATAALDRALEERRTRPGRHFDEARIRCDLARAHLESGDAQAAREEAEQAVLVAREQGARILSCLALLTRAHVLRVTRGTAPDDESIAADLTSALTLMDETGARAYEAFIREELARLRGDQGELRKAFRLFSDMGATGHARRLLAELETPANLV